MPYSQHHADIACNFFECLLKHTADEYWGKPFLLIPWQEECLGAVFGTLDDDSNRVIELVYLEVPKKAGKTEFVAGIVLLVLIMTSTPGCQVYGAASATRQALNVYRAACKMVEQSPILSKRLIIRRGTNRIVKRNDPDSFYAAVAADGDFGDGVNPSFVVADEVHRWKTRKQLENWDVLTNGGITRRQTLTIAITTAGAQNESPLAWRLHEKTLKINKGVVRDPKFWGRIYGAEVDDDPAAESTWIKANPSLIENGGFLPLSKIREKYQSALSEGDLTSFKRYFLNIWDQKENRAIDMVQWNACRRDWEAHGLIEVAGASVKTLPHDLVARFIERKCWVGVDLSLTTDLSAVSCVFPRDDKGYDVLAFPFLPEEGIRKAEVRDGMPYREWARQGWIETSPGRLIDYGTIKARIAWACELFNVQEICFDPYNSREMSVALRNDGLPAVEVPQRYNLNEPTKRLLSLVASGDLVHGGHPVLAHHASCLSLSFNGTDLVKPAKPDRLRDSSRIDTIAATINALAKAMVAEKSVTPGFVFA